MEKNILLKDGLAMIELEERLEMIQLGATEAMSCCFDSSSNDSVEVDVNLGGGGGGSTGGGGFYQDEITAVY
jgi:hypothetical protein